jgi:hypothetical protein
MAMCNTSQKNKDAQSHITINFSSHYLVCGFLEKEEINFAHGLEITATAK